MKKTFMIALVTGMLALSSTAAAQTKNDEEMKSDVNAVNKDNASTDVPESEQTATPEKKMEKSADQKTPAHHKNKKKTKKDTDNDPAKPNGSSTQYQ